MTFGSNPTTTTESPLATDQIYLSSVATPNTANGDLTALEGGPVSTDSNSNKTAPASMYVKDGNDVTQGLKADTAITDATTTNTKMSFLKGLVKIFADIWDSAGHRIRVDGSGVTQPVSGSVSVNTISNYAAESGGNLAGIKVDADTLVTNTTGLATQTTLAAAKTDLDTIVTNTNKIPASPATEGGNLATLVPGVQGWIAVTGNGTANQENTLTFIQQVRKVVIYNASANNVPLEFDQTAAATSIPIPPGAYWIIDNVLCTTVHIFPSVLLPINTTNGLYVKGWK